MIVFLYPADQLPAHRNQGGFSAFGRKNVREKPARKPRITLPPIAHAPSTHLLGLPEFYPVALQQPGKGVANFHARHLEADALAWPNSKGLEGHLVDGTFVFRAEPEYLCRVVLVTVGRRRLTHPLPQSLDNTHKPRNSLIGSFLCDVCH